MDRSRPRRSLPGEQCGYHEGVVLDHYISAADVAEIVEAARIAALANKKDHAYVMPRGL